MHVLGIQRVWSEDTIPIASVLLVIEESRGCVSVPCYLSSPGSPRDDLIDIPLEEIHYCVDARPKNHLRIGLQTSKSVDVGGQDQENIREGRVSRGGLKHNWIRVQYHCKYRNAY